MRNIIIASLFVLIVCSIAFKGASAYTPIRFYDSTGEITNTYVQDLKVWMGTVQPTTSNGYGIDISSAGFTQIKTVSIIPIKNTADANSMPDIAIKTMTNTMITVNIKQGNSSLVSVLGLNVLSGAAMLFPASVSDVQLIVRVTGK